MGESTPRCRRYFLLGPTASGKTTVALSLAPRLQAEILSMDSMLVYRGMDLGTAKPSGVERAQVPHHLIDLVTPDEEFSVARWLIAALEVEADLQRRGLAALYVGGTNLYLQALTAGLLQAPEIPAAVRLKVQQELASPGGSERLRAELAAVDAALYQRLHPNDERRVQRAIEVYRATGRPLSEWQQQWGERRTIGAPAVALEWSRETLRQRVAQRFEQMLEQGLVAEIEAIEGASGFGRTAAKALGYRQLRQYLRGECSLEQARERAVTLTRTFIRRQMTWLRSFSDLQWIGMEDSAGAARSQSMVAVAAAKALGS